MAGALAASMMLYGSTRVALAAPGDGACTVTPSPASNLEPTAVTLSSASDDATDPISAHVALGHSITIRDVGGDGTAIKHVRTVTASEMTVDGEDISFTLPAADIAGQFEVITNPLDATTSDCSGGVSGIYDGLAINQTGSSTITTAQGSTATLTIRGTSGGNPLARSTMVTVSTTKGEFHTVNGAFVTPAKVLQMNLIGSPVEGSALGSVGWRAANGEKPGSATITASAKQGSASLFKSITATIAPPPIPAEAGFAGTIPLPGQTGLLVLTKEFEAPALANGLGKAACTVQTLAVLIEGDWAIYVTGAPDAVNAGFPSPMSVSTPFFVRCE